MESLEKLRERLRSTEQLKRTAEISSDTEGAKDYAETAREIEADIATLEKEMQEVDKKFPLPPLSVYADDPYLHEHDKSIIKDPKITGPRIKALLEGLRKSRGKNNFD